ncbi:hypothetical protein BDZ94DRAFT_1171582 [Collybia nuda]|uniref:BTB domain-containing protein n=1 Tax=Collybia nuda TaxID=64659 RepID=A0A9P5XZC9_9AGAR|nr:hypothetical protein BDZ94DRAFT_1171582 [Collybia nuda]
MAEWSSFHCDNPDFVVKSVPDNITFAVNRNLLGTSEIFRDMFSCCDTELSNGERAATENQVDLHEPAGVVIALLRLLHHPPAPPTVERCIDESEETQLSSQSPKIRRYDPTTVIPLPILLSLLYGLVDKYALPASTAESLNGHLLAHAPTYPLRVYGFATIQGLDRIASEASQYMLPLGSYRLDEVQNIPTVDAYHKLVRLQDLRVKALRKLVLGEDIFPHGYGACRHHHQITAARWDEKRKSLAVEIDTVTDVAGEMATLMDDLPSGCDVCLKAYMAAVKMLAYKSRKIIRRIDQLPAEV